MAKPKYANLIFKSGEMKAVPMKHEMWPPVIHHRVYEKHGNPALVGGDGVRVTEKVITFTYVGVQHGVGAYVEAEPMAMDGGHRSQGAV